MNYITKLLIQTIDEFVTIVNAKYNNIFEIVYIIIIKN